MVTILHSYLEIEHAETFFHSSHKQLSHSLWQLPEMIEQPLCVTLATIVSSMHACIAYPSALISVMDSLKSTVLRSEGFHLSSS